MRLSPDIRALVLEDLKARERYTVKAICRRYGVSRATLWRLQDELRNAETKQNDSDIARVISCNYQS